MFSERWFLSVKCTGSAFFFFYFLKVPWWIKADKCCKMNVQWVIQMHLGTLQYMWSWFWFQYDSNLLFIYVRRSNRSVVTAKRTSDNTSQSQWVSLRKTHFSTRKYMELFCKGDYKYLCHMRELTYYLMPSSSTSVSQSIFILLRLKLS